jgi:hypothetical protein
MNENCIWIPNCENYGGYTDRHVVLSKNNIESYLNIFNNIVLKSNEYFMKMKTKTNWNLERLIKFILEQNNVGHLVKEFPYIMYTVRNINGSTRWTQGIYSNEFGYFIKYQSEYDKSTYYKNEFETSGLNINEFWKLMIFGNFGNSLNMLYFIPYGMNFGDELNIYIINKIVDILNINIKINFIDLSKCQIYNKKLKTFSFLGSIMHILPENIDVLCTGVNPNYEFNNKNLNILSLRGNLSKNYLINKGYNIGNIVLGDPALLIPRLFPEWLKPLPNTNNKIIGIIPHYNDILHIKKHSDILDDLNIECYYPNNKAIDVINFIRSKNIIISSSLHAIIVSEMLNKNVKWIMYDGSLKSEGTFKYDEYFMSTNRHGIKYAKCLTDALEMNIPKPEYNDNELFNLIRNYLI